MRFTKLSQKLLGATLLAGVSLGGAGCATHTGTDALIGGTAGAGIGAAVSRRPGVGALAGGLIGAAVGGLIGNEQDRNERIYGNPYGPPPPVIVERRVYYRAAPPPPPPPGTVYEYREVRRYDD